MIEYSDISRLDRQRMSELMKDQSKEIDPSLFKKRQKVRLRHEPKHSRLRPTLRNRQMRIFNTHLPR